MAVSILHVGLPLDHALIPVEDRAAVRARLDALRREMRAAGYEYEIVCVDPDDGEGGIDGFKERLRVGRVDGVLVGGGVVGNPAMSWFLEELVEAVREVAPGAKVMLHSHAEPVRVMVERWFAGRDEG